ncbi:MAG TPA: ABC transporter permease [Candidatus Dormibacteraeota bacterium]|nr:ABC transporter permease [Candidatus Dormibacteraeota bacterium]
MGFKHWAGTVIGDFKYALRTMRRSPGYVAIAVMTLALGIGANTAIFSLLDQVLLRLLPVKNPKELVLLTMRGHHYGNNWGGNAISHPMFRDFQAHNEVFSGMFCRFPIPVSLTFGGQAERVNAELVSGTYFSVLGVNTILGRAFTPEDDRVPLGHPLVMLTYDYWRQRFGGDAGIVGKNLIVNGHGMTVAGVVQPGFDGVELGFTTKIFIPIMMEQQVLVGNRNMLTDRRSRWVNAFGRLKPGVSATQAKVSLEPFMHSMLELEVKEAAFSHASAYDREQFLKCWIDVLPGSQGRSYTRRQLSAPLWVLMATTGLVLLIACANLANLLLARAVGRQKEIAVRLAIGASRVRIISQLLTETLSLAALGGIVGLAIAFWADRALLAIYLPSDSTGLNITTLPDLRILIFTLGVTILTGVVFGLVPALQTTRPDVGRVLKDEAGGVVGGGGQNRLRKSLVVAQVALSLLLLIGAGLFLRSLENLSNLGPGFPAERLVGFNIDPSLGGYTPEREKIYLRELTNALSSIPGVQSVGLASMRILEDNEWDSSMTVEGYTPAKPEDRAQPYMNQISPGYFATLGVPIVAGRDFRLTDDREIKKGPEWYDWTPTTVMINEKFAKKFFPGRNPIGMHIGFGSDPGTRTDMEVIGVVKDIKYTNLRDEIPEQAYIPYLGSHFQGSMTVYLRTAVDPNLLMPSVREKVRELDPNLPIYALRTTETQIGNSLVTERMIASLSSVFGFLATMLAVIGLYGVMSYTVAQRTREIGIRMALGAEQGSVVWMVMREVLRLIVVGVVAGIPAALALTRVVQSQLFGLTGHDPRTLAIATVALTVVACAAGYIPALRASRLDPMKALRYE